MVVESEAVPELTWAEQSANGFHSPLRGLTASLGIVPKHGHWLHDVSTVTLEQGVGWDVCRGKGQLTAFIAVTLPPRASILNSPLCWSLTALKGRELTKLVSVKE